MVGRCGEGAEEREEEEQVVRKMRKDEKKEAASKQSGKMKAMDKERNIEYQG